MSRLRWLVLTGLALLAGCGAAVRGPRPRDLWHGLVHQGQRYGYQHTTVKKLPDGNFQYTLEARILMDLLGAKQEISRRAEYVVTPSYRPVSFKITGGQLSGPMHHGGRVEDGKLIVTFSRAGLKQTRTLELPEGATFTACLDDWVKDLPAGVTSTEVKVVLDELWTVATARATRRAGQGRGAAWNFDLGELLNFTVWYDADGLARKASYSIPRMDLHRCTAEQARQIRHLDAGGRYVWMFQLDKELPPPGRLKELTLKLTWRDIPLQQFQLEDSRQRLVRTSEKDGNFEAVVKLASPEPLEATPAYPIREAKFAACLSETLFVKPQDEAIVAAAREIVAGKKTALEAVEALTAWVYKNVKPALFAETLSGPEVLQRKQGKCAEYSTLFASLARSLGIPARMALGVRLAGSITGGHMWNEAYVGRWITVDASANEVGESLALVKFVHSDSVLGTQPLRWALTESLNVAVEDFQARPSALAAKYKTGVQGGVYTNVDYACRLTAPVADWAPKELRGSAGATVRFEIPQAKDVYVHFVAFALPAGTAPKVLTDARLGVFKLRFKGLEILKNEPRQVSGAKGHTLRFRRLGGKEGKQKLLTTEVVWTRGSAGYLLNLIAEESAHEKVLPDFEKLLASFEFLSKE